jgi:hypothetical protein
VTDLSVIDCEPPNLGTIEALERMLDLARAGDLSSVAIAFVRRDGCTGNDFSDPPSRATLIGAVAMLQAELIAGMIIKEP